MVESTPDRQEAKRTTEVSTVTLTRGEMEKPPLSNDRGWRTEAEVISGAGKHTIFMTVWEWSDGRPCEIFLACSKTGSELDKGLVDNGKNWSRILQAGVPLSTLIAKLRGEVGLLSGQVLHRNIRDCSGIQDLVAQLLELHYSIPLRQAVA